MRLLATCGGTESILLNAYTSVEDCFRRESRVEMRIYGLQILLQKRGARA